MLDTYLNVDACLFTLTFVFINLSKATNNWGIQEAIYPKETIKQEDIYSTI